MEFLRKRTLSKLSENFSSRKAAKAQRILASLRLGANILLWIVFSITLQAQPFANEIADFKKADSISKPPANPILFVGSSSFRLWADIQSYVPGYHASIIAAQFSFSHSNVKGRPLIKTSTIGFPVVFNDFNNSI